MSANERSARAEKLERRQKALDEQSQKNRTFKRNAIIVVIVVVLLVAAALIITSDIFYTSTTAVRIGNTSYSPAETSVFFHNAYNSFYNQWSSQIQSLFGTSADVDSYITQFTGLDRSVALDEQMYNDEQTWSDYFMEQAKSNMQQVTALCDAAQAAGYVLPDSAATEVENEINTLTFYATNYYGYSNLEQFLSLNYGKGVTKDVLRRVLTKMETASHYAESVEEARSYTDEQLTAYYSEHADELDVIGYYNFLVSSSNEAFESEGDDDAKLAAARAKAAEIAESADLESYLAACAELGNEPTIRYLAAQNLTADQAEWLMSADRKDGDATSIEASTGAYAMWFVSHDDNDYATRSMRHILISAVADEDGSYSDEARFAAEARVHEIEQEWKENPTEEHFIELANQYSEDSGSNTNGGLYENIQKHSMVTDIDAFLFEDREQPGDTTIVEGNNGSYDGYHLVYYVGEGQNARCAIADPLLREEEQNAWLESLTASGYEISTGSGLRYVKNT